MHTININKLTPRQALKIPYNPIPISAVEVGLKEFQVPGLLYTYEVVVTWVNKPFYCWARIKG